MPFTGSTITATPTQGFEHCLFGTSFSRPAGRFARPPQPLHGKLRALAIASSRRFAGLPDVPTASEAGLPGFEASVWYAMLAPTGTPEPVIAKLNAATNDFLKTAQAKELFEKLGIDVAGGTPNDLRTFVSSEIEKWAPIIKNANIEF